MKATKKIAILLLMTLCIICFGSACTKTDTSTDISHFVVDSDSYSDEAAQRLQSMMTLSAIKLQMPDSIVLKANATSVISSDNNEYFVLDYDGFFVLDRQGRLVNFFNRRGQGPEEYNASLAATVHGDTLYVVDFTKIQLYKLNGEYISTIKDIDGARGQITVDPSGRIYIQHRFNSEYQLSVYRPDGTLIADLFPSREVVRNFAIPSSPQTSLGNIGNDIYMAPALDQTIYLINDTTTTTLATFDFGSDNIPDDFFDGTTEQVEDKFHNRRDFTNGFIYLDDLYISKDWIECQLVGSPNGRLLLADRRTGDTYAEAIFPEALKKLLGTKSYFDGFDNHTQSLIKVISGYDLAESLDTYPGSVKLVNCDSINEEDDDFILLVSLK